MIGVFDSGVGGLCAFMELRRLLPREDIIYLADRKNAPYGTKTKEELIALTKKDIQRLKEMGAGHILIACCTASTVYPFLNEYEREISLPIITPAASVAARYESVYVIATRHTAESGAFCRAVRDFGSPRVTESAEQKLVWLVENGARDGKISRECEREIHRICTEVKTADAKALVLGCTHFTHLEGEFKKRLRGVKIISPAKLGAEALYKKIKNNTAENGRNIYL